MILAIDPGNIDSAYVLFDGKKLYEFGKVSNREMRNILLKHIRDDRIKKVVIEMVACYGMPVGATVFDTCVYIGRFTEIANMHNMKVEYVYRKDIKMFICGRTSAKDSNVSQALRDIYGEKGTKKNPGFFFGFKADIWQAFAVAHYHLNNNENI